MNKYTFIFIFCIFLGGRLEVCAIERENSDSENENNTRHNDTEHHRVCQIVKLQVIDNWQDCPSCDQEECLSTSHNILKQVSISSYISTSACISSDTSNNSKCIQYLPQWK